MMSFTLPPSGIQGDALQSSPTQNDVSASCWSPTDEPPKFVRANMLASPTTTCVRRLSDHAGVAAIASSIRWSMYATRFTLSPCTRTG